MNKAESERLGAYLEQYDYQAAAKAEEADLVVLNSCVVRQSAENRVIGKLNALKSIKQLRPGLILVVTGCLVDSRLNRLKQRFPQIDYFLKPGELPSWIGQIETAPIIPQHPAPANYVNIIQGCDNFCSYCIVPYRRGRERSRPVAEIVSEVEDLVHRGVKEVTLLGQNVDSYGHDLPGKPDLAELLDRLNDIDELSRLRFLTNHPKDMSSRLIERVAHLTKVCEEISLPVQSGSNDILKLMRRGYNVERYLELVAEIRGKVPDVALSTDVIVGFPSETEAQFRETYRLLSALRFDKVHVAVYSPRPGTIAARKFIDDVPFLEKKGRLREVERLQEEISADKNAQLKGKAVEILIEGKKNTKWQGRTRGGKLVFFEDTDNWSGKLAMIHIDKTSPWALQGSLDQVS